MATQKTPSLQLLLPVGRLIAGNPYAAETKNADGTPKINKKTGEPSPEWFVGFAIPKVPGQQWQQTPWGAQIASFANQYCADFIGRPGFAWKIQDGDSQIPNTKGRKNCDDPNKRGNWIIACASKFGPTLKMLDAGSLRDVPPDFIKKGHWVEPYVSIRANTDSRNPGLFLSATAICWREVGPEIVSEAADVSGVGFGQGAVPQNAAQPSAYATAPAAQQQVVVQPNHAFVQNAAAPVPPLAPAPVIVPVPRGPQMAQGCPYTYEALVAAGWSEAQMRQAGHLV